jgi:deoxyribodipyrimidine photolyase-related protein
MSTIRQLIIVLGDQLNADSPALQSVNPDQDLIWMAEVRQESQHVPSSKIRTALFLSTMRHFAREQVSLNRRVEYIELTDPKNTQDLGLELQRAIQSHRPRRLTVVQPGDWRVLQLLRSTAQAAGLNLEVLDDSHFLVSLDEFNAHAKGRKQLRLEYFYREVRQKTGLLMQDGQPVGGQWNFDVENRGAFDQDGPSGVPSPCSFEPDAVTQGVIQTVADTFASHIGDLSGFHWPVTRGQALACLDRFIQDRLPLFGRYQDAMWSGEAWLYHSHLSSSLNLKLLNPLEVAQAAEKAWKVGHAPIEAVEGFIRQVIGWREYVRGIYWTQMPDYLNLNALSAKEDLPGFFWTGQTDMACLKDTLDHTLRLGYSHHIQRLMVTGLYALLFGVQPSRVHEWYLSVYVDAVEWVEVPNTIGMSQFADGGLMASKPYAATGQYIDRMSNHCKGCRYKPKERLGPSACPFTTLYWDFLIRHKDRLSKNPRMVMQLKNLNRLDENTQSQIRQQANDHRRAVGQNIKPTRLSERVWL